MGWRIDTKNNNVDITNTNDVNDVMNGKGIERIVVRKAIRQRIPKA